MIVQDKQVRKRSMVWLIFVAGAVLSWGAYGALLQRGQVQLGNPLKALLCVGAAYFFIGVIVPVIALGAQGGLSGFNRTGLIIATAAGALGAIGAACIIWAFRTGGLPVYVMPLVFAGAPIVNVTLVLTLNPPKDQINPMLYVGFLLAAAGAGMVLYFRPHH
jgi:hypothetical protein